MCLSSEDVTGNAHQLLFLAFLLFFTGLFPFIHVHPCFLVPCKEHQGYVQRATVTHFQGFHHRQGGVIVFLYRQDSSRLALQFATQMSPQFQSVRDEVQHTKNTRVIDTSQPIEFIYHRHTFRFIVGTLYEVGDAVNDNQLDAAVLVVEFIHALHNSVQTLFA